MTSYDAFRLDCGQRMAEIFRLYGLPEMPGHILGVLVASAEPLSLGDLAELLGAAKSTVSVAARRLEAYGVVIRQRVPGDRRDHYLVQDQLEQAGAHVISHYLLPEARASVALVQALEGGLEQGQGQDWPDEAGRARLRARSQTLGLIAGGSLAFLGSLVRADGSLDQARISQLIALLTQLQEESP